MAHRTNQYAPAETVKAALADQLDCYRRLAMLSKEQSQHVFAADTEKLLTVLARREALTSDAAELEGTLGPIKSNWPQSAAAWSDENRSAVETMFRECRQLLGELTRRDERDAASLRANLALASNARLRADADSRVVRKINQRYAASAYHASPKKFDKSS